MSAPAPPSQRPGGLERTFNRLFGIAVGLGLGLSHGYLLQVQGQKTGRLYSTPVNLLEREGRRFLVAPRGYTQWVRNAEAVGEVTLKRGRRRDRFRLRAMPDAEKPRVLKAYLDPFETTVRRYFPVPARSPLAAFAGLTDRYPVFELLPHD